MACKYLINHLAVPCIWLIYTEKLTSTSGHKLPFLKMPAAPLIMVGVTDNHCTCKYVISFCMAMLGMSSCVFANDVLFLGRKAICSYLLGEDVSL